MKKLQLLLAGIAFLLVEAASVFAGGNAPVPEINFRKEPTFISPGSSANGQLTLPISPADVKFIEAIKSFELAIYNKNGEVVFEETGIVTDNRTFFARTFGTEAEPIINLPENIVWNGRNKATGQQVPDDVYFYQLVAKNDQGLGRPTPPLQVVVDTVAPEIIELNPESAVFSPNGDGVRDTVTISHRTGTAYLWTYEIRNAAGATVWTGAETRAPVSTTAPDVVASGSTTWDGKSSSGQALGDGNYTYIITGVDRAGNTTTRQVPIRLSTDEAALTVGTADGQGAFSPEVTPRLELVLAISDTNGLQSWKVDILDKDRIAVRRFEGTTTVPPSVVFNGRGNPGRPTSETIDLPDGTYTAEFSAIYENGNNPVSEPFEIILDRTAPSAGITIATSPTATELGAPFVFGGATKPRMIFTVRYEEGLDWDFVLQTDGGVEYRAPVQALLEAGMRFPYTWDGTFPAAVAELLGLPVEGDSFTVPDGLYVLALQATDEAGNVGSSNAARFVKDTADRSTISAKLSSTALSPGGDAGLEVVRIEPQIPSAEYLEYMVVNLVGPDNRPWHTTTSRRAIQAVEWAGTRNNGLPAPDGEYSVEITLQYMNGDNPIYVHPEKIALGRSRPNVTISVDNRVFTPNGDGDRDTLRIQQTGTAESEWIGRFTNDNGDVVRTFAWTGQPGTVEWDGRDGEGNVLPDGYYHYDIQAINRVGNVGKSSLINLRIDNLSATINISPDLEVFSPNGDGYRDQVLLSLEVAQLDEVRGWEVELVNTTLDGRVKKLFQGSRTLPQAIAWDGVNDAGTIEDGVYTATLKIDYANGSHTERTSDMQIILVKTPPKGEISVSPERFSPDGDGQDDTLTISLDASASDRAIARWRVEAIDPAGNLFKTWQGDGTPPATLVWDGKGDNGELVQSAVDYLFQFRVEDNLRNFHLSADTASVDVLVMRDGNRLRILIPSIVFAGNTADLFSINVDQLGKNLDTLRRLASILNRYSDYKILIEGHAVQIYWNDATRGAAEQRDVLLPLSRARATEVRQALTILGVDWGRMSVEGIGGARPIVPHSDEANRWKNRRVEFILEK